MGQTPEGAHKTAARRIGCSLAEYEQRLVAGEKWCGFCRAWHPREDFQRDASRSDGLKSSCWRKNRGTRKNSPGQRLRRAKADDGLAWCRECKEWRSEGDVHSGLCRSHQRAAYRDYYARNRHRVCQQKAAYRSRTDPLPQGAADLLTEQFGGRCAYCRKPMESWDHIVPTSGDGKTEPGNVVPACTSCNSSKNNRDVHEWVAKTGRRPLLEFYDTILLEEVGLHGR